MIVKENGSSLSFIGDAILSLMIREHYVRKGIYNTNNLQNILSFYSKAPTQSKILEYFIENNIVSEEELSIINRGRNARMHSKAKNSDIITYRKASGLEALFGYLYLYNMNDRLNKLFNIILENFNE